VSAPAVTATGTSVDVEQSVRRSASVGGNPAHQHSLACAEDCAVPAAGVPAVRRLAAVAMPEMISVARTPAVTRELATLGAGAPAARAGLASGFGPSTPIVPAAVAGSATAPMSSPAAGLVSDPPRPGRQFADAASNASIARSASGSGTVRRSPAGPGPSRSAVPTASPPTASTPSATTQPRQVARTSYLPAPPPISIRPAPVDGPELPAAARGLRGDIAVRRTSDHGRADGPPLPQSALAESTAHLFQAARLADGSIRRSSVTTGGSTMSPSGNPPIRRAVTIDELQTSTSYEAGLQDGQSALSSSDLDDIVERVIDKIEQRVVDELERRGRHYSPGVF
jgi:hypothetical protein